VARTARITNWKLYMGTSLGIVSRNTQRDVEVHTHTTSCGRNTRRAEHQHLYRRGCLGDLRTWRSIDVNMFVTENTSGMRNEHE
jgi:hypothetical protein